MQELLWIFLILEVMSQQKLNLLITEAISTCTFLITLRQNHLTEAILLRIGLFLHNLRQMHITRITLHQKLLFKHLILILITDRQQKHLPHDLFNMFYNSWVGGHVLLVLLAADLAQDLLLSSNSLAFTSFDIHNHLLFLHICWFLESFQHSGLCQIVIVVSA